MKERKKRKERQTERRKRKKERKKERQTDRKKKKKERKEGRKKDRQKEERKESRQTVPAVDKVYLGDGFCLDKFTRCHTEIDFADQTRYLTQTQCTDTRPTDTITPGVWEGSPQNALYCC